MKKALLEMLGRHPADEISLSEEDGIRYLQAINFKDREHKPVSIAAE